MRGVVAEGVRAARARAGEPEAESVAAEIGRRVGRALAREASAPDLVRALGEAAGEADRILEAAAEGLVEGFMAMRSRREAEPTPSDGEGGAVAAAPPSPQSLVAAARQAAHDLNQPLTVILGYAAILKRAGTEALRVEAAEHIAREARKMSGIVAGLSRLTRKLDAA